MSATHVANDDDMQLRPALVAQKKVALRAFLDQTALDRLQERALDGGIYRVTAADGSENRNYVENQKV